MPIPPVATLWNDADKAPQLVQTQQGLQLTASYRVNTADPFAALSATGAPVINQAWSTGYPTLRCINIAPRFLHGTDNPTLGTGGWCELVTQWSTWFNSKLVPPTIGTSYTEWLTSMKTVEIYAGLQPGDAGYSGAAQPLPLANGAGTQKEVPSLVLRVHVFKPLGYSINMATWLALASMTNTNSVTVPAIPGTSGGVTFTAGQLKYRTCTPVLNGSALEMVHEMDAAPDFLFRWRSLDQNGKALGSAQSAVIYGAAAFPDFTSV